MKSVVRGMSFCAVLSIAVAMFGPAHAQSYPERPIRLIVPFPPGGSTDVVARILAQDLSTTLKQNVIVENKAGAAGTIGIQVVAQAKPDGYTFGVSGVGPVALIPLIDKKLAYDPVKDLSPIVEGGTVLSAELSARLLQTIFFPGAALHDLAVIVKGNVIHAAGVQLPLADPIDMPDPQLGSRHRAALGVSKECDALVVVVSEETGQIRIAERGRLSNPIAPGDLRDEILHRLKLDPPATEPQTAAEAAQTRILDAPAPTDETPKREDAA